MTTNPRVVLEAYAVGHEAGAIGCRGFNRRDHAPAAFAALRVVLDEHVPVNFGGTHGKFCKTCTSGPADSPCPAPWPCPTVRAITTALEAS